MKTKQTTRVKLLDSDTGEVIDDGDMVYVPRRLRMKEGWFMAMQDGLAMLAKQPLRGESMRVLLYLMSEMEFENYVRPTHSEIAAALSMQRPNVSRAIRELRERHVLIDGEHGSLRLESSYGWRGKVKSLRDHQQVQQRECEKEAKADAEAAMA
ncbi:helix-turn-helix domain-containing protein [Ramlibacter alkalitolerans]|uniref:Winged helix-turn-helix domain-containing protein n=1 Tax=Ramlibacter alkalitolerans TaxID=2039631 RepID=A0ABS1JSX5_9BURK|nr:helix-turn-helix domain-containing protein [Ramlibacter alkalitolerans]MBL0427332.1 winged helix-turn-helix domain-containing protein [Ramlibacter alkalitolerans]